MSGRLGRKVGALIGAFGLCLTTGAVVMQAANCRGGVGGANQPDRRDQSAHYSGPYPNWANSAQVFANAVMAFRAARGTEA